MDPEDAVRSFAELETGTAAVMDADFPHRRLPLSPETEALWAHLQDIFGGVPETWTPRGNPELPHRARQRGWVAVPRPGDKYADGEDISLLAQACRARGIRDVVLVPLEDVTVGGAPAACLAVEATEAQLDQADDRWWYGILTAIEMPFVVLENDEYHVVAGPPAFVEEVVGASVDAALREFREYAYADFLHRVADLHGCPSLPVVPERIEGPDNPL